MFVYECKANVSTDLLSKVDADTDGASIMWEGGEASFLVFGTFGGGTCKLQVSSDNNIFIDYGAAASFAAAGHASVNIAQGLFVRAILTGATTPSLTAVLAGNHQR